MTAMGTLRATLIAVLMAVTLVALDVSRTGATPLNLVQPGSSGPSEAVFRDDFPDQELLRDTGLDGQQFYAVARNPLDLDEAALSLDRPRYRLQRPLLSWLAWLGHPVGGGTGLILSLFVVNVLAVALLAASTASLSSALGGPRWTGALVGLYPGVWWSLRVTVADALAVALAVAAIALVQLCRTRWATLSGTASVFAKETAVLVIGGWALRRPLDRRRWVPVIVALTSALAWALFLRLRLAGSEEVGELVVPLTGLRDAVRDRWLNGDELWGLVGAAVGIGAAVAALLRRGLRHPLGPAVAIQLGFLLFANGDVLGNDFGAGRATLPALALATVVFFAPGREQLTGARPLTEPGARCDAST